MNPGPGRKMQPFSLQRILTTRLLATGLGLLLYCPLGFTQTPYTYYPGYRYPYPQQQQNQQPQEQRKTQQPATPQQNYRAPQQPYRQWQRPAAPAYQQGPRQSRQQQPAVEAQISSHTPFLQQNLVLTLRVISDGNLSALHPKLPAVDGLAIKLLDGPIATSGNAKNKNHIVNEYHFSVTPLRPGTLTIPPLSVSGSSASGSNQAFSVTTDKAIQLEVKPANETVRPWLPLNGLILQAYLEDVEKPEAGKPIGLAIDISAVGITGNQLPSLEPQMKTRDFRIYRESTDSKGRLSPDRRLLMGTRIERFTLVPQHGGKLQIPQLSIHWWNVDTHSAEVATIPIKQIVTRGEQSASGNPVSDLFPGASNILLWVPLIAAFLLTAGFWILAWLRQKRFIQVVEEEIAMLSIFAMNQLSDFMAWLSPIRRLQKIRLIFVSNLPRSFRLWFCVKSVNEETDPEIWTYMLRFLANKHLGLSPQLPLATLGQQLTSIHEANNRQMELLMQELDGAVYGNKPIQFEDWKKRFRQQLRPNPFRHRMLTRRVSPKKLPPLNPGV